jgi:hypothetical protein
MQLIAPDIMELVLGLSLPATAVGLVLGVLLWLSGWWGHRFWIVLFITVAAGIVGMVSGQAVGLKPAVTGLLLAVSAGMMALSLVRLVAFFAGGAAVCLALQLLIPAWEDRFIGFLAGGLAGLLLFRLWTMTFTSLFGTLMMIHCGLALLDRFGKLDAALLTQQRASLLNWSCAGLVVLGVLVQYVLERWQKQAQRQRDERVQLRQARMELEQRAQKKSWWRWGARAA